MTRSRRATAAAWAFVTAVTLAGAVLTVMASGHLVTSDTVANLGVAPPPCCTPRLARLSSAARAT